MSVVYQVRVHSTQTRFVERLWCAQWRCNLVVVVCAVVQCFTGLDTGFAQEGAKVAAGQSETPSVTRVATSKLPALVQDMRDAILAAVMSGDISEMRIAIEWNELRPELGMDRDADPIDTWKSRSQDGEGYEILAILGLLLEDAPARLPIGRDIENNDVYVWPYLAELDGRKLTPQQMVELYQRAPPAVAARFVKTGTWDWYRIAIGADGTWHIFSKGK